MRPTPPLMQFRPSRQPFGLQHGCPVPPQAEHIVIPTRHEDCEAVHAIRSQQTSPTLPHAPPPVAWHDPALQVPGSPTTAGLLPIAGVPAHVAPLAWQTLNTQQPPPLQTLAGQHSCPGPPHSWGVTGPPPSTGISRFGSGHPSEEPSLQFVIHSFKVCLSASVGRLPANVGGGIDPLEIR